jgi:hypothetical protein
VEGLRYVYPGNVPHVENTFCHVCGRLLIRRSDCGTPVAGMEMEGTMGGLGESADWRRKRHEGIKPF